jgi:hypothetical protein
MYVFLFFSAPWKFPIQLPHEAIRRYKSCAVGMANTSSPLQTTPGGVGAATPSQVPVVRPAGAAGPRAKRRLDTSKENESNKKMKMSSGAAESAVLLTNGAMPADGRPRIIFSASDDGSKQQLSELVSPLGGSVVTNVREATHLVMDSVEHTIKFFTAMAGACRFIVTSQWIKESHAKGKFLRECNHFFYLFS